MNYLRIHDNIISKAKLESRKKNNGIYYEKHHIIPRCMQGTNNPENLVLLTAKEHFLIHLLLTKIYPDCTKLVNALWMMCTFDPSGKRKQTNSRLYEYSRQLFSQYVKNRPHPFLGKNTLKNIRENQAKLGKVIKLVRKQDYYLYKDVKIIRVRRKKLYN